MKFAARVREVALAGNNDWFAESGSAHYQWAELSGVTAWFADALAAADLGSELPVAIIMRNRPSAVAALAAVWGAGRCPFLISPIQAPRALAASLRSLRPAMIVADRCDWSAELLQAAADAGSAAVELADDDGHIVSDWAAGLSNASAATHYRVPEGTGVIVATSGTTGPPRPIPISASHLERYLSPHDSPALTPRRTVILALPLTTITGVNLIGPCLVRPHRVTLMERVDVNRWADLVEEHRPRRAGLPPAAMQMMLDNNIPRQKLASLECWVTGSAPLSPDLAERFERTYGIPVLVSYGATELGGTVAAWSVEDRKRFGREKRGSSGRPAAGVELRVVDVQTGTSLPAGQPGVLEVRSARAPQPAAGDGWLRTSDLARVDSDGWLYIDGRTDDIIIRGGFKVPLAEIEQSLLEHPAVERAAAVGLSDARLGQVPAAAVVLRPAADASAEELMAWLRDRLAPYKVPTVLAFLESLPLNASLKVSRPELKELIQAWT